MAAGHYLELSWGPIAALRVQVALGRSAPYLQPTSGIASVKCPHSGGLSYPRHVLLRFDKWSCGMKARALINGASFSSESAQTTATAHDLRRAHASVLTLRQSALPER